jgi:hypothetical protein
MFTHTWKAVDWNSFTLHSIPLEDMRRRFYFGLNSNIYFMGDKSGEEGTSVTDKEGDLIKNLL